MISTALSQSGRLAPREPEVVTSEVGETADGVVLRLLNVRARFASTDDLTRVFRHRYVLAHYLGLAAPIFAAFLLIGPRSSRDSEHMPSVMIGIVVMLAAVALWIGVIRWWHARRGTSEENLVIPLLPGLMFGVAVLMAVSLLYGLASNQLGGWTPVRLMLLYGVLVLYVVAVAMVILLKPVPRALAEMRARDARLRQAMLEPDAAHLSTPARSADPEPAAPAPADPVPAILQGVLRVEAQGNNVLVVTERGRHLLPGPFGKMVARLPADLGRQVHRSHWVACRAVLGMRRQGRDLLIETVDGARVPVAASKHGPLRDWLAAAARHGSGAAGAMRQEARA